MLFFEEVMTIFQKIGSEKKLTWDVQHKCPQLGAYMYIQLHICSGFRAITNSIAPQMGIISFFADPIAVVFFDLKIVSCIQPPKRVYTARSADSKYAINTSLWPIYIKSYEQFEKQKWYYKIISGNYYNIIINCVFPKRKTNQLCNQGAILFPAGSTESHTPASAEGASFEL